MPAVTNENAASPSARPPSKLLWAAELPRGAWNVARLGATLVQPGAAPRGDGRPVMVLPGLFNTDRSTAAMRLYLRRLGYAAHGWALGRNLGRRSVGADGERLFARLHDVHEAAGAPVTLVGVSLGGMMARLAAHRLPELVREIITVSSPFAGNPRATNVWRAFEWVTGDRVDSDRARAWGAEIAAPPSVRTTAIWSASDGLVNGAICHDPTGRHIKVHSSHMGVQFNPAVLRAIAEVLAGKR